MLKAAMQKKKGDKDTFTMTGQYASPVMYDEETSREFVMYESPNGEQIQVFGNWNEYAVSQDEDGREMIADEDYPIRKNENGEFVFDEAKFEEMQLNKPEKEMAPEAPAEKVRRMMMGGKIDKMPGGGYMKYDNGGGIAEDPEAPRGSRENPLTMGIGTGLMRPQHGAARRAAMAEAERREKFMEDPFLERIEPGFDSDYAINPYNRTDGPYFKGKRSRSTVPAKRQNMKPLKNGGKI